MQRSLPASDAAKLKFSLERQLIFPSVCSKGSVSVQAGYSTIRMLEVCSWHGF